MGTSRTSAGIRKTELSTNAMIQSHHSALSLAARESAEWWLWIIAFVESSVFLIPAEVLLVPMGLARPQRAYRYALVATVGSVLGGIAGWLIGYYAYELVA